jgi:hypothetical protein
MSGDVAPLIVKHGTASESRSAGLAPALAGCPCNGCQGLRAAYAADPALLSLYARKLLVRGWAGRLDDVERAYVAAHAEWHRAGVEKACTLRKRLTQAQSSHADGPEVVSVETAAPVRDSASQAA